MHVYTYYYLYAIDQLQPISINVFFNFIESLTTFGYLRTLLPSP